jgi:hypothetical protein
MQSLLTFLKLKYYMDLTRTPKHKEKYKQEM